ncbi:MAG TPA: hypothetical protein VNJ01_03335 [Bacteriovoracaceae bacterium]|nr:hypothetical protein [Bacteriovoracaceae bacterium]
MRQHLLDLRIKLFTVAMLLVSLNSFAQSGNLFYADGAARGKDVSKLTTYIGYNTVCFVGSGAAAKGTLWNLLDRDGEKTSPFVRYDKNSDKIIYGYVDSKCTDEGNSDDECRQVFSAIRCQLRANG